MEVRRLPREIAKIAMAGVLATALMPSAGADAAVGANGGKTTIITQCDQMAKGFYGVTGVDYKCPSDISVITTPIDDGHKVGIRVDNGKFRGPEFYDKLRVTEQIDLPIPDDPRAAIIIRQEARGLGTDAIVLFSRSNRAV